VLELVLDNVLVVLKEVVNQQLVVFVKLILILDLVLVHHLRPKSRDVTIMVFITKKDKVGTSKNRHVEPVPATMGKHHALVAQ